MILELETLDDKLKGIKNIKLDQKFIVGEWRALELSCPDIEELPIEAIVIGYLIKYLPKYLAAPLCNVYKQAVSNYLDNEKYPYKGKPVKLVYDELVPDKTQTNIGKRLMKITQF